MPRARKLCTVTKPTRCLELAELGHTRCTEHEREADRRRGTSTDRGYNSARWRRIRRAVLLRDPVCTVCQIEPSTVADHYPTSRRQLVDQGVPDPDALHRLRGVGARCHGRETARRQPGGWANRT